MVPEISLLVRLVDLIETIPSPPPAPRVGRPPAYSDRLLLKALVIMLVRGVWTVDHPSPDLWGSCSPSLIKHYPGWSVSEEHKPNPSCVWTLPVRPAHQTPLSQGPADSMLPEPGHRRARTVYWRPDRACLPGSRP